MTSLTRVEVEEKYDFGEIISLTVYHSPSGTKFVHIYHPINPFSILGTASIIIIDIHGIEEGIDCFRGMILR